MSLVPDLIYDKETNSYKGKFFVCKREYGYGITYSGCWVLRSFDGDFVDYDQFRNDLFERNDLSIQY